MGEFDPYERGWENGILDTFFDADEDTLAEIERKTKKKG